MKQKIILFLITWLILTATTKAQTQPTQKQITLQLPVSVIQTILKGLDELPLKESGAISQYIISETNKQLQPTPKTDSTTKPKTPVTKHK